MIDNIYYLKITVITILSFFQKIKIYFLNFLVIFNQFMTKQILILNINISNII